MILDSMPAKSLRRWNWGVLALGQTNMEIAIYIRSKSES